MISNFHSAVPARRFASAGEGEVVAGNAGVRAGGGDALEVMGRHALRASVLLAGLLAGMETRHEDLAAVRHQLVGCELLCLRLADCGHGAMPCEEGGFGEEGAREPREHQKTSGGQEFFHGVSSRIAALHAMIRQRPGDHGRLWFQYRSRHRAAQRRRRNILLVIPACAGKTGSLLLRRNRPLRCGCLPRLLGYRIIAENKNRAPLHPVGRNLFGEKT